MTMTEEPPTDEIEYMPRLKAWEETVEDEHGDFRYTLHQFLLMRRLNLGGEWSDIVREVGREIGENPDWDVEERDTFRNWRAWYFGDRVKTWE